LKAKKLEGKVFGNVQNLTDKGRALGLAKIRNKSSSSKQQKKILGIIQKCRKA